MVATIHRDPYRLLIRKIGYSVGLERTIDRVSDLVQLYVDELSVTSGAMARLIHSEEKWNLKTTNIIDLFNELDLVRSEGSSIFVLPTLDALAILRISLTGDDYERALHAVLLFSLLSSDGDILLNCMSSGFDRDAIRDKLISMVEEKRRRIQAVFTSPQAIQKIDRYVTIETQKSNKGGAVAGQGVNALQRREPLSMRRGPLASEQSPPPQVSDDYLRKVPGRRRDWSVTLGLLDDRGNLLPAGERLFELFNTLGQSVGDTYTFWPYRDELVQLNLKAESLPWTTPDREAVIYGLKNVVMGTPFGSSLSSDFRTIGWLRDVFKTYRTLNPSRSMVRVELPLRVARLVALGFACANEAEDHDVLAVVLKEQDAEQLVELRPSRQHEGSIVFRGNA